MEGEAPTGDDAGADKGDGVECRESVLEANPPLVVTDLSRTLDLVEAGRGVLAFDEAITHHLVRPRDAAR